RPGPLTAITNSIVAPFPCYVCDLHAVFDGIMLCNDSCNTRYALLLCLLETQKLKDVPLSVTLYFFTIVPLLRLLASMVTHS
ncbi:MAG: hypothetical protein ABFD57_08395, partial [Smithella sp.]